MKDNRKKEKEIAQNTENIDVANRSQFISEP